MERFHVSGIPPPTKNADFAALIDPFGEGNLVPSKLDPDECRGFGYISINRKKRSEVLKLLREHFGAEVMLQKPKEDPRDVKTREAEAAPAPVAKPRVVVRTRKSRLTLNTSKKLRVFDSDDDDEDIQRHDSPHSKKVIDARKDALCDAALEGTSSARRHAVSAHEDDNRGPKRRKKDDELLEQWTPLTSGVRKDKLRSSDRQAASSSGEEESSSSSEEVVHRAARPTDNASEATHGGAKEQKHAEGHDSVKEQKQAEGGLQGDEVDEKVEAVDDAEVQRQKDVLFSMFPSMVPRKQQPVGRQSSLVVSRFDPSCLPHKKPSSTPVEEPAKRRKVVPTPSSASAPAKTPVQAPGPTKSVVNPLFKDVFKTKESTETTDGSAGTSWLNSILGGTETPSAPTPSAPDVLAPTATAPAPINWIDSVIGVAEPKTEIKPVAEVNLAELPPFWRRGSEKEILDAWSTNKAWYAWDLKSKHRSVARAKKAE